jgi:ABC-type amino acid transport substrate-binding protein
MKKTNILAAAIVTASVAFSSVAHAKQTLCVFDLLGTGGDVYAMMKDYSLAAAKWGADVDLKPYTDERIAAEDFKAGQCDAVSLTGLRGRQFNTFTGSIDSIGAITTYAQMRDVLTLLSNTKMAPYMVSGAYEVVGVMPLGAGYLLVNDRAINNLSKVSGKKIAVLDYDKSQAKMVQKIGAQPVASDITNFAGKFNNGQVDIVAAPAVAIKPLELYKGLGTKGAIIRFPIVQITGNVIINPKKFPAGFGQKSREYVATQVDKAFKNIEKTEKDIPAKYWMDVLEADKPGYIKLMRESRISLAAEGIYDKKMLSLLKRVRCKHDPASFECALKDE